MKKSWGLLPKILSGEKTVESRWYQVRAAPWGHIATGDTVYFKNSGEPVTVRAEVKKVESFEDLTPEKVRRILEKYAVEDGIVPQGLALTLQGEALKRIGKFFQLFKNKRYCLLIFLKDVKRTEPINIDKRGFGSMSAWLTMENIQNIKI